MQVDAFAETILEEKREWFLAAGAKKVGPMTRSRVLERIAGGRVPMKTKGWREGMEQWLPLAAIPELRAGGRHGRGQTRDPGGFQQVWRIERRDLWRAF